MSSKRGFPARTALAAAAGVVALISVAAPAMADDDGWGWKKHHGHYKPYIVAPGYVYGGFYAPSPPVIYYQPAPVYVEPPPPMVYAPPPPVYYAPPSGLSFGINVPLR